MKNTHVGNEDTMESEMMKRFGSLQDFLSSCQLPEEYKEILLGCKPDLKSAFCMNVGPDNAVDMIFAHKRCNGNDHVARLVVHVAGPFWPEKQLYTSVTADREDEGKTIATEYYANIHKYPDTQVSICNPDAWTTNIGEYPFLVGLFRFFFAASGLVSRHDFQGSQGGNDGEHEGDGIHGENDLDEDDSGHGDDNNSRSNQEVRPRSCMQDSEMPMWYEDYIRRMNQRQPSKGGAREYEELCRNKVGLFSFTSDEEREACIKKFRDEYQCDWPETDTIWIVDEEGEE
ncbi:MAG: hypothetical protein SGBAC_007084 [Bacillariaceae sp.]